MTLALRGLRHEVPTRSGPRTLYRELSLTLAPGTFTAVVGPNGAGKSTLLRQLVGVERPATGVVLLEGEPLVHLSPRSRARRLAYLPQSTPLYYDLRVDDVVMLGRTPYIGRFSSPAPADHQAVAEALAQVAADELAARVLSSLSGGERQRVMLARLLATRASILVLDEATTALDIGHTLAFLALCRTLARAGHTLVAAMHELELARRCADAVLCLDGRGGHAHGPPAEVMTAARLAEVFQVRVVEDEPSLAFYPVNG